MTALAAPSRPGVPVRVRFASLDRVRGLAVALMVLDHLLLLSAVYVPLTLPVQPWTVRETLTRAALPLFFVLSGHLATRLRRRHLLVGVLGLALPSVVPWVDSPNVLFWYALGAVVVVQLRRLGRAWLVVAVVVALTAAANYYLPRPVALSTYEPVSLVALMAVGALLPVSAFAWGDRLPAWLGRVGRYPLSVYVGHLLVLQAVVLVLGIGAQL